jgi:hypothetical protein
MITARLEEAIRGGAECGEFRSVHAAACAHMIVGMIWHYSANLPEPPETIADVVADLFLNGALVRGGGNGGGDSSQRTPTIGPL